jgi:hypothetical protein
MPKTGTSVLQNSLFYAQDLERSYKVLYATTGRDSKKAHHEVAISLSKADQSGVKEFSEKFLAQVSSECESHPNSNIILFSSEAFSNLCGISVSSRMLEFFSAIGKNYYFRSYIFIREFSDFFESMYLQSTRFGHVAGGFIDYLEPRKQWARKYIEGIISLKNSLPENFNVGFRTKEFDVLDTFENILYLPKNYLTNISKQVPPTKKRSLKEEVSLAVLSEVEIKVGFAVNRRKLIRFFESGGHFEDDIYNYTLYDKSERREAHSFFLDLTRELGFIDYLQAFGDEKIREAPFYPLNIDILSPTDIKLIQDIRKKIEG